jgi:ribosomal protein L31
MKPGIHPEYREVVFVDVSNNFSFKTRSTINTKEKIKWEDGNEYPLAKIETSSESHPFFTGTQKIIDTARNLVVRLLRSPLVTALLRLLRNALQLLKPRRPRNLLPRKWPPRKRSNCFGMVLILS